MSKFFQQQKKLGKIGEAEVKAHLESLGCCVYDYSEMPQFQKYDIDFMVVNEARTKCIQLEVKLDRGISKYGNLFFEKESENVYGEKSLGWVDYTKAAYLCFYDDKIGKGYIVDWKALKPNLSTIGKVNWFHDALDQKMRKGILVSIGKLKREGYIKYSFSTEL